MTQPTTPLYDAMIDFFTTNHWPYLALEGDTILTTNFEGENARWTCYAQVREEQQQFIFYSLCPITIPEDRRADVLEFLTRTNYGLIIGNFEVELEEGEVRYKTSFDCEDVPLTPALFKNVVYPNLAMMDQYLPAIFSIVYAEDLPLEELEEVVG